MVVRRFNVSRRQRQKGVGNVGQYKTSFRLDGSANRLDGPADKTGHVGEE